MFTELKVGTQLVYKRGLLKGVRCGISIVHMADDGTRLYEAHDRCMTEKETREAFWVIVDSYQ